jgi:hypothetical protein
MVSSRCVHHTVLPVGPGFMAPATVSEGAQSQPRPGTIVAPHVSQRFPAMRCPPDSTRCALSPYRCLRLPASPCGDQLCREARSDECSCRGSGKGVRPLPCPGKAVQSRQQKRSRPGTAVSPIVVVPLHRGLCAKIRV